MTNKETMHPYRAGNRQTMPELRAECRRQSTGVATTRELITAMGGAAAFTANLNRLGITFNPRTVEAWGNGLRCPPEYTTQLLLRFLQLQ